MDKEKVIKAMEQCISQYECSPKDCPYYIRPDNASGLCWDRLMTDAIVLLKEQGETTRFVYDEFAMPMCEVCGFHPFCGYIPTIEWMKKRGYKKCPYCGREAKWDA